MARLLHYTHSIVFVSLIGISVAVGWFMPDFYEWTGSDQSRPSPLLWQVPMGTGVAAVAICCLLPWLPINRPESQRRSTSRWRFGLRSLLILTTAVAAAIPLFAKFPTIAGSVACAIATANLVRVAIQEESLRLPTIAFLACMLLPYAWVVHYAERDRILTHFLTMIATWPTFFPAAYLNAMLGKNLHETDWIAMLMTASEVAVGTWIICLGPKRTIAYLLLVLLTSAMGSLVFYQLCVF